MTTPDVGVRLQVPVSSSQCALLLPKNTLLSPELPFYFPEVPLCFLEFPFCFPEVLFSRIALQYAQSYSNLENLKISTWIMNFHVFYSNFSLRDSLENAVSEHLK